ncbi:centrosomal protein POC5 isoform X2 [Thalassophryne amazonica]|nr:centrosomal protein POC5 isoform X2 [Thalassophryne amazonica]
MSSDSGSTSPVLPKDSDRGSSVSSELQEEYEELLQCAIVTPKLTSVHLQPLSTTHRTAEGRVSQRENDRKSQHPADSAAEAKDEQSIMTARASQTSPSVFGSSTHSRVPYAKEMMQQTCHTPSSHPDPIDTTVVEMFISEDRINKMDNILDTWNNNLKANVRMELGKWKFAFVDKYKLEMKKEREKSAAHTAELKSEIDTLKELLKTFETSNRRKDELIENLNQVLDRQNEKLEKMRAYTHWRLKHTEAKEEAHAMQVAQQHYSFQLKKKVWLGWHALIQKPWKIKVEQACRARAEEVCTRLSAEYEAKLAEHCEAIQKAQAEIHQMQLEQEHYEESVKKAFMRGVCALNMEALSMFHTTEGRLRQGPVHDQHDPVPPHDEPESALLYPPQPYPMSHRFSPGNPAEPRPPSEVENMGSGRVIAASQQKPSRTVTARITSHADVGKGAHSNLHVMGVAPPSASVTVERHHPVTKLTIGQAMAARFPHSSQMGQSSSRGKSSSRTQSGTCIDFIKVVD